MVIRLRKIKSSLQIHRARFYWRWYQDNGRRFRALRIFLSPVFLGSPYAASLSLCREWKRFWSIIRHSKFKLCAFFSWLESAQQTDSNFAPDLVGLSQFVVDEIVIIQWLFCWQHALICIFVAQNKRCGSSGKNLFSSPWNEFPTALYLECRNSEQLLQVSMPAHMELLPATYASLLFQVLLYCAGYWTRHFVALVGYNRCGFLSWIRNVALRSGSACTRGRRAACRCMQIR
jgi:hypothetical protein